MARKNKKVAAAVVDGETRGAGEERSEAAFWTALKHADTEALQALLFDELPVHPGSGESAHDEGGAARLSVKPTARALVNALNAKKERPLSFAIANDVGEDILQLLLRAGAEVNGRDETKARSTALHAAYWGEDEIAAQLLLRCGADVRIRDGEGRTALHVLASSNAAAVVTDLLERIASPLPKSHGEDEEGRQWVAAGLRGRVPLLLDPLAVLLLRDRSGATALDLALAEVGYGGVAVAEAVLDFVEQTKSRTAAEEDGTCTAAGTDDGVATRSSVVAAQIDALVNGPAEGAPQPQGQQAPEVQPALHCLLSADQGDLSCIARVLPRLLALGAAPLRLNAERRTALDMAALHTSPTSEMSATVITQLLQAMRPVPGADTLRRDAALRRLLFCRQDEDGHAFIHTAILSHHTRAVRAVWDFVIAHRSEASEAEKGSDSEEETRTLARQCFGEPTTASGETTAQLLANTANADAMAELLLSIGALDRDVVEAERAKAAVHARQVAEAAAAEAARMREACEAHGDYSGSGPTTTTTGGNASAEMPVRPLGGATGTHVTGASRVQQARKARAVTLAQRRQQQQQERQQQQQETEEEEEGEEQEQQHQEEKNKKQQPRRRQQQQQQKQQQQRQKQNEQSSEAGEEAARHEPQRETTTDTQDVQQPAGKGQMSAPLMVLVLLLVAAALVLLVSGQK